MKFVRFLRNLGQLELAPRTSRWVLVLGVLLLTDLALLGSGYWNATRLQGQVEVSQREKSVHIFSPGLAPYIEILNERSPTFRSHLAEVQEAGYPIFVSTYEDAGMTQEWGPVGEVRYWATMVSQRLIGARIVIDTKNLTAQFSRYMKYNPQDSVLAMQILEDEIAITIAHEIEHVYDIAVGGGWMFKGCNDPKGKHDQETACIVGRENLIRAEMGIPQMKAFGALAPFELVELYGEMESGDVSGD